MNRVLVADDEADIISTLSLFLEADGFEVSAAQNGHAVLEMVLEGDPDLLILDWNLPDIDGLRICTELRKANFDLPIMLLTGRDAEFDKVAAFDAGADDYVTKPFSLLELASRCRALLRRRRPGATVMAIGDITLDQVTRQVLLKGEALNLTPKEFSLLVYLASNLGHPVSREVLLHNVWGYQFYGNTRTVDVHVSRLRNKLKDDEVTPHRIITVKSIGYQLVPCDDVPCAGIGPLPCSRGGIGTASLVG